MKITVSAAATALLLSQSVLVHAQHICYVKRHGNVVSPDPCCGNVGGQSDGEDCSFDARTLSQIHQLEKDFKECVAEGTGKVTCGIEE
ncbi:hypothetical protein N7476_004641 [Penicillium atrosanguineum]|uniref:Uncharacterized protein n=1 Tax=Penicillium atrosanguineum TaxID=1132637 RepID=A0A9W9U5S3_9EURO|nr:hypothetical protein N7526_001903 [Penicillium atrosanguineum]KAJ5318221.1 hypothetical protein N7476_004641 [Penicillium atrosanguineum]